MAASATLASPLLPLAPSADRSRSENGSGSAFGSARFHFFQRASAKVSIVLGAMENRSELETKVRKGTLSTMLDDPAYYGWTGEELVRITWDSDHEMRVVKAEINYDAETYEFNDDCVTYGVFVFPDGSVDARQLRSEEERAGNASEVVPFYVERLAQAGLTPHHIYRR